jgi:isoleucyl-tRNA synthetase
MQFTTSDLSAFYFDVRKDALYCDPISSVTRRASLTVIDILFNTLIRWLAPLIPFTAEEAWLLRNPGDQSSVHLQSFAETKAEWRNDELAEKWEKVRRVRRAVTGALEIERAAKKIGSSLEAIPVMNLSGEYAGLLSDDEWAEVCITSGFISRRGPSEAGLDIHVDPNSQELGVSVKRALDVPGARKCARSWKILPEVGSDEEFPDLTPRDAAAMREWLAARR